MKRKQLYIFMSVWALLIVLLLAIFYIPKYIKVTPECNVNKIDIWTYKTKSREYPVVLPTRLKEEQVEIYTTLPEKFEDRQILCFWTFDQDVKVFLDDTLIYEMGEELRFGKSMISQWNYVDIPSGMDGHMLKIQMETPYKAHDISLKEVIYGSADEIQRWMIKNFGIAQMLDHLIIIAGIIFILSGILRNLEYRYRMCHICFGVTAILFGIGMRLGMQGLSQYWINGNVAMMVFYLCFFMIPIPLTIYLRIRAHRIPIFVKICSIMLVAECLTILVVFGMQALGIRDIRENLMLGQIGLLFSISWSIFVAMTYYIKRRKSISILTVANGFLLMIAVGSEWANENILYRVAHTGVIVRLCILTIIVFEFIMLFLYVKEKEKIQKRIQEDNRNLQLQVMTGQIRPHFILNTLGAIRSLIRIDANRASDLLYDFSKYVRRNMEQKDYSKLIPFLEELDYIKTYLKLETLRFDDKLQVEYDIKEKGFWILPLTIQPFVENAVKHGLLEKKHGGTVTIATYKENDKVIISIKDDGVGFDTYEFWAGFENRKSVGMKSAIFRLEKEMNAECQIESSMQEENSGTWIKIILPEKGVYKNANNNRR